MASTCLTNSTAGEATAPHAGDVIASLSAPASAYYRVRVFVGYGSGTMGTPEDDGDNFGLFVGGAEVAPLIAPPVPGLYGPYEFAVALDGSSAVDVRAILAGSPGVSYLAHVALDALDELPGGSSTLAV